MVLIVRHNGRIVFTEGVSRGSLLNGASHVNRVLREDAIMTALKGRSRNNVRGFLPTFPQQLTGALVLR